MTIQTAPIPGIHYAECPNAYMGCEYADDPADCAACVEIDTREHMVEHPHMGVMPFGCDACVNADMLGDPTPRGHHDAPYAWPMAPMPPTWCPTRTRTVPIPACRSRCAHGRAPP